MLEYTRWLIVRRLKCWPAQWEQSWACIKAYMNWIQFNCVHLHDTRFRFLQLLLHPRIYVQMPLSWGFLRKRLYCFQRRIHLLENEWVPTLLVCFHIILIVPAIQKLKLKLKLKLVLGYQMQTQKVSTYHICVATWSFIVAWNSTQSSLWKNPLLRRFFTAGMYGSPMIASCPMPRYAMRWHITCAR